MFLLHCVSKTFCFYYIVLLLHHVSITKYFYYFVFLLYCTCFYYIYILFLLHCIFLHPVSTTSCFYCIEFFRHPQFLLYHVSTTLSFYFVYMFYYMRILFLIHSVSTTLCFYYILLLLHYVSTTSWFYYILFLLQILMSVIRRMEAVAWCVWTLWAPTIVPVYKAICTTLLSISVMVSLFSFIITNEYLKIFLLSRNIFRTFNSRRTSLGFPHYIAMFWNT